MRGLPYILALFRNEFNKFNTTRAPMLDSVFQKTITLLKSKKGGNDRESIQSSTTPDPGYHMGN